MNNNFILQIETATPVCSVAISKGGQIIATVEATADNIHASHLTVFVEQVLEKVSITLHDLSAVAVSMGPGSYTGLRIGVSVAKGLCYALDIPLIAVNTLYAMYDGFKERFSSEDGVHIFCPMIDARRMEVYSCMVDQVGGDLEPIGANIIDEHSFDAWIKAGKQVHLFGSGAVKFDALYKEVENLTVHDNFLNSAAFLTSRATIKLSRKEFEDVAYFEPYYLKDFVATTPKKK